MEPPLKSDLRIFVHSFVASAVDFKVVGLFVSKFNIDSCS